MSVRKIDLMHTLFGDGNGFCKDCCHFLRGKNRKCKVYGNTSSEATDWNASYMACGLKNRAIPAAEYMRPIVRLVQQERPSEAQIDGQMTMEDFL